jgi:hypothetical protein
MASVDLSDADWQQVMAIIATAPWRDANPLLMKIGAQLQGQVQPQAVARAGIKLDANGKEASDGSA